jgi:hypothetical protein
LKPFKLNLATILNIKIWEQYMALGMGDLKKGLDGVPYKIMDYAHVKPGKGAAFVR